MTVTENDLSISGAQIPAKKSASTRTELKTLLNEPLSPFLLDSEVIPNVGVSCKRCEIPLTGREQFLGHMAISHEIPPAEAVEEWEWLIRVRQLPNRAKEVTG